MSRIIKLLDNENIEIVEYKKANACFQTNEYPNDELFCVMRETFNPFDIFQEKLGLETENKKLENIRKEASEYVRKHSNDLVEYLDVFETKELDNILNKGSKDNE